MELEMKPSQQSQRMREALADLTEEIIDFYENINDMPIAVNTSLKEIREHLSSNYNFEKPQELTALLGGIKEMMRKWNTHNTHPRHFGLFNPSVGLASIMADALVALYNPQLATTSAAPVANEIEQYTLRTIMKMFGYLPEQAMGNFTTGGAEANLSAVLTALTKVFPEYAEEGLSALERKPVFYLSEEGHHSFDKISHITGLGRKSLRFVEVDAKLRMKTARLKALIQKDKENGLYPFLVIGTAGTTNAGVIDPLAEISNICKDNALWFHVDAAWGGAAVLSPRLKPHLDGIEKSDSVTCDAHKWFSVSMGAGMFFCKHPKAVAETFRTETAYMPKREGDSPLYPFLTTIQWSRRFIGLKLFMALSEQGTKAFGRSIEHHAEMAEYLRHELKEEGWKLINETPLPVVCFSHPSFDTGETTPKIVLEALYKRQIAWISETTVATGQNVLRACISSFRTQKSDIDILVKGLSEIVTHRENP